MDESSLNKTKAAERAISCKTLICFVQSLIGEVCDVELKNDLQLNGRIVSVDAGMNVEMDGVTLRRPKNVSLSEFIVEEYDYLYLKGEKIRYVQFSDEINVRENIETKLDQYHYKGKQMIKNRDVHHKQKRYDDKRKVLSKFENKNIE